MRNKTRNTKKKVRQKSKSKKIKDKLNKELWELVKTYIRLRDKNICQHCLKEVYGVSAHTSHVKGKKNKRLKYNENNLKVLCAYCHRRWWHVEPLEAASWFDNKFPDRAKYIVEHQHEYCKHTIDYLEGLIRDYSVKITNLRGGA